MPRRVACAGALMAAAVCAALRTPPPPRMMAAAGDFLRIAHRVDDVDATAAFYTKALGLEQTTSGDHVTLQAAGGAGLSLELVSAPGVAFKAGAGYQGLSARVPSVADAVAAVVASGGSVLSEVTEVEHGASQVPDENEELTNPVMEAVVADPSGYPLLLHECTDATAACLSGARLSVYEWKRSQEWCAPHDLRPSPPLAPAAPSRRADVA